MQNNGLKLVIILIFLTIGCGRTPKGIIPENRMAEIIIDLKSLEAQIDNFLVRNSDSSRVAFDYLKTEVFEKHNTDSATYAKSYEYYLDHSKKMMSILKKAENRLENYIDEENTLKPISLEDEVPGNRPNLQRIREH